MKLIALTSAAILVASTAFAGNVDYNPDTTPPIVVDPPAEQGSSGGSAGWIVPLIAIGLIALAVSQKKGDPGPDQTVCYDHEVPIPCPT